MLEEVRQRLKGSDECILIATSLIEAGVDVDFRSVYRQLAGIDSIVQAAGRCNREGRRSVEDSKVYIFTFSEKEYMPGQRQQMDVASSLMDEQVDFSAPETARDYFKKLYYLRRNELDKKKIMDEFQRGVYNFSTASKKFKLIDEHTVTIFIPQEEDAKQLLKEIRYKGYTKSLMRKAGQYSVNVYTGNYDKLAASGMLRPVSEDIEDLYELCSDDGYTEEYGLRLDIEMGMGVFM